MRSFFGSTISVVEAQPRVYERLHPYRRIGPSGRRCRAPGIVVSGQAGRRAVVLAGPAGNERTTAENTEISGDKFMIMPLLDAARISESLLQSESSSMASRACIWLSKGYSCQADGLSSTFRFTTRAMSGNLIECLLSARVPRRGPARFRSGMEDAGRRPGPCRDWQKIVVAQLSTMIHENVAAVEVVARLRCHDQRGVRRHVFRASVMLLLDGFVFEKPPGLVHHERFEGRRQLGRRRSKHWRGAGRRRATAPEFAGTCPSPRSRTPGSGQTRACLRRCRTGQRMPPP